jgi:hypothetical protein
MKLRNLKDFAPFCLPPLPGKLGGTVLRRRKNKCIIITNATPDQVSSWLGNATVTIEVIGEKDNCILMRIMDVYEMTCETKEKQLPNGRVIIELSKIKHLFPREFEKVEYADVQKFLENRYEHIVMHGDEVSFNEVREYTILQHEAELLRLQEVFDTLEKTYQCPFCGYVGKDIGSRRVKVSITWNAGDEDYYEPAHQFGYIDFCECPRCRKDPPNGVDMREKNSFVRRWLVIATTEFMEQFQKVKELLSDELRWIGETSYKGVSMFDLPERARKLVAIARDLVKDPSFILVTPEEVERPHD